MPSSRTWWKGTLSALRLRSDIAPAGDIVTTSDEGGIRVADGVTPFNQLGGVIVNARSSWFSTALGMISDLTGRVWMQFMPDGTVSMTKAAVTKALTVGVAGGGINPASSGNIFNDLGAVTDTGSGRAWLVFKQNGSTTVHLSSDSVIPPALSTTEVISARGPRPDLNTRLSSGLTPYGFPRDYMAQEWYLRWTRMLTRRLLLADANTQFDIAIIGDSYSQLSTRYSGPLWTALKTLYGDAGIGWVGFSYPTGNPGLINGSVRPDTTCTVTGAWTQNYYGTFSPDLGEQASSTLTDQIVTTFPAGQSSAKLYYKVTAGATVSAQFNGGGTLQSVDLSSVGSGAGSCGVATLTAPSGTATTLTLIVTGGTVTLFGVDIRNGNNGIRVHKIAATGSTASFYANVDPTSWNAGIASLKPKLVIIMQGTNDQGAARTPSLFSGNMQTIITNLSTALGATAFDDLIMMPAENQRGLTTTMASYTAVAQPLADTNKAAFLDLQPLFGENASDYAFGSARPWYASDLIHPDPLTGGRVICDALVRLITGR